MNHRESMVAKVAAAGWRRGAMLGLGSGTQFEMLLRGVPDLHLIGVDHFARDDRRERLAEIGREFADRCTVHPCTTALASNFIPDRSLDFIYLDAGHRYGCVRSDLRLWWPKVRVGGWFGGHDFAPAYPGVVQAVTEKFGRAFTVDGNTVWQVGKSK